MFAANTKTKKFDCGHLKLNILPVVSAIGRDLLVLAPPNPEHRHDFTKMDPSTQVDASTLQNSPNNSTGSTIALSRPGIAADAQHYFSCLKTMNNP